MIRETQCDAVGSPHTRSRRRGLPPPPLAPRARCPNRRRYNRFCQSQRPSDRFVTPCLPTVFPTAGDVFVQPPRNAPVQPLSRPSPSLARGSLSNGPVQRHGHKNRHRSFSCPLLCFLHLCILHFSNVAACVLVAVLYIDFNCAGECWEEREIAKADPVLPCATASDTQEALCQEYRDAHPEKSFLVEPLCWTNTRAAAPGTFIGWDVLCAALSCVCYGEVEVGVEVGGEAGIGLKRKVRLEVKGGAEMEVQEETALDVEAEVEVKDFAPGFSLHRGPSDWCLTKRGEAVTPLHGDLGWGNVQHQFWNRAARSSPLRQGADHYPPHWTWGFRPPLTLSETDALKLVTHHKPCQFRGPVQCSQWSICARLPSLASSRNHC